MSAPYGHLPEHVEAEGHLTALEDLLSRMKFRSPMSSEAYSAADLCGELLRAARHTVEAHRDITAHEMLIESTRPILFEDPDNPGLPLANCYQTQKRTVEHPAHEHAAPVLDYRTAWCIGYAETTSPRSLIPHNAEFNLRTYGTVLIVKERGRGAYCVDPGDYAIIPIDRPRHV